MAADTSPLALDGNFDLDAELDDLLDYTGSDAPTDVDMAEMRAAGVDLPVAPKAPAQPEAAPEQQGVTEKEVQQYAKIAKNVYDVYKNLTGKDLPQDFPQQDEGQTDEEYATEVEAYVEDIVGVDIDTNGLAPGSAEFYARVSDATDAIIAQILGEDAEFLQDATVEELQEALKGRREAELEQLARALAVRGQISTLSGVSERVNPFTGQTEEIGFNGMLQSADKAAAQKGFERESEALSGMRGAEARTYLDELLGRNADIYGLRAGRNARILAERLNPEGDMDWRRRAGGRGFDIYDPMLQQLSPRDLEMLLSGIDENEQGAAIERLFGC
jgi:hypothetical protein